MIPLVQKKKASPAKEMILSTESNQEEYSDPDHSELTENNHSSFCNYESSSAEITEHVFYDKTNTIDSLLKAREDQQVEVSRQVFKNEAHPTFSFNLQSLEISQENSENMCSSDETVCL